MMLKVGFVVQSLSRVWLCEPMNCSTPGFPVLHHLPELTQTYVLWVSDAIQPSHPLLPPSPLAFSLSQHQGLFQQVGSSHQVAKVLERQLQHQSFQTFQGRFPLQLTVWSCCPRVSVKVFSTTTVRKQQFFSAQPPFYGPTLTSLQDYWKNHSFDYMDLCQENGICESKSRKPCPSVGMKYLNVSLSLLSLLMILTVCNCVRAIM